MLPAAIGGGIASATFRQARRELGATFGVMTGRRSAGVEMSRQVAGMSVAWPESEVREKVLSYIELISSTGKRDPDELAALGVEYLRKIVDGPDWRFSVG